MMTRESIGKRIREIREEQGITMEKLVEMVGDDYISVSTVQRIEHGKTKISTELLLKIMEALNAGPEDLFDSAAPKSAIEKLVNFMEEEPDKVDYYLDQQKLFYPDLRYEGILDWRKFPIKTLSEFIIYLPLIDKKRLADVLSRLQGTAFCHESYLLEKLEWLYDSIPEGNAKTYADHQAGKMNYAEYIRYNFCEDEEEVKEYIRKELEIAEISDEYMNILKEQCHQYYN